jgi:hypothetical protein
MLILCAQFGMVWAREDFTYIYLIIGVVAINIACDWRDLHAPSRPTPWTRNAERLAAITPEERE